MRLVVAEKPSVAQSIAKVIGAYDRKDGYVEGSGYIVSWCVGHLVGLAQADAYDERYRKWNFFIDIHWYSFRITKRNNKYMGLDFWK